MMWFLDYINDFLFYITGPFESSYDYLYYNYWVNIANFVFIVSNYLILYAITFIIIFLICYLVYRLKKVEHPIKKSIKKSLTYSLIVLVILTVIDFFVNGTCITDTLFCYDWSIK